MQLTRVRGGALRRPGCSSLAGTVQFERPRECRTSSKCLRFGRASTMLCHLHAVQCISCVMGNRRKERDALWVVTQFVKSFLCKSSALGEPKKYIFQSSLSKYVLNKKNHEVRLPV